MQVFVNGRPATQLNPADRGLHYGDGLFETIAMRDGRPRFMDWHFERLTEGARRLGFPDPEVDRLRSEIGLAGPVKHAVIKLILTRGPGERGYRPPRKPQPTRVMVVSDWPKWPDSAWIEGVRVRWCRIRLGRNRALAGIKHLNRLEQVLARAEWDDDEVEEGLMQDDRDLVISAIQANLFARVQGAWVTPLLDESGVAGVMRRAFRRWSGERGEPVAERVLAACEVEAASALLLTNALIGAWPVRELAGRPLHIDPVARQFNAWLAAQ